MIPPAVVALTALWARVTEPWGTLLWIGTILAPVGAVLYLLKRMGDSTVRQFGTSRWDPVQGDALIARWLWAPCLVGGAVCFLVGWIGALVSR
jgi:hypothetical protein